MAFIGASDSSDDVFKQIEKQLQRARELAAIKSPPPPHSKSAFNIDWNPLTGPDTVYQERMLFWFNQVGICGILKDIEEWAEAMSPVSRHKAQYETLQEEDSLEKFAFYIASLPPLLIQAVIYNNIPSMMMDPVFRAAVEDWVDLQDKSGPGVYIICVANKETGLGPSLKELVDVFDTMSRYIDLSDVEFRPIAKVIDLQYPQKGGVRSDYATERRYCSRRYHQIDFQPLQRWLEELYNQYISIAEKEKAKLTLDSARKMDLGISRCFCYIGWAKNLNERSHNHTTHAGSENPIFGLYSAVIKYLYEDRFRIQRYALFHAIHGEHAGIAEIFGHALASSYLELGGFNHHWAGGRGFGVGLDREEILPQLEKHQTMIKESGNVNSNLTKSLEKAETLLLRLDLPGIEKLERDVASEAVEHLERVDGIAQDAKDLQHTLLLADIEAEIEACDLSDDLMVVESDDDL